jgi:uncharacterized protein (DUF433 family)
MKQITILVSDDQQAHQIVDVLSDFDSIQSIDIDPIGSAGEQAQFAVRIVESEVGPMISHSRVSVYDVMEAYSEGYNPSEICDIYNLSPHQVDVALAYIEQNRSRLEPKLKEIQAKLVEREQYHRALVAEREKQFPPREMTPEREAFYALLEKSRRSRGEI